MRRAADGILYEGLIPQCAQRCVAFRPSRPDNRDDSTQQELITEFSYMGRAWAGIEGFAHVIFVLY